MTHDDARGLVFDDLVGGYGTSEVIHGVGGRVAPGEVVCVIGRNGVGKTTLVKLLLGYLPAWRGTVRLDGVALDRLDVPARRQAGVSYGPQERPVFDDLDVRDNLTLMRPDRSLDAFAPCLERFPILGRRLGQAAGTLSGGEKKILSFTRAWAESQPYLLLDEPSEGVQWENILHMVELIAARRARGCGLLVVEQNLAFAERIADRYLLMDQGRVVFAEVAARVDRERLERHLAV